jgi:hypothetical protein
VRAAPEFGFERTLDELAHLAEVDFGRRVLLRDEPHRPVLAVARVVHEHDGTHGLAGLAGRTGRFGVHGALQALRAWRAVQAVRAVRAVRAAWPAELLPRGSVRRA